MLTLGNTAMTCLTDHGLRKLLTYVLLAAAAVIVLAGCSRGEGDAQAGPPPNGEGAAPPATVRVAHALEQSLQTRWDAIGRLIELRRAVIAAEVSGKIMRIDVQEGDRVVGGKTVLAEIDGVWAKLALEAADATIKSVQARLDQSRRDADYLAELSKRGSANQKEVEDARAKVLSETAELDAAVAERNRHTERIQRLAVTAPFDGVMVAKHTEVGQWVSEGSPIAEVITVGQIDAIIDVPERFVTRIRVGATIPLLIEPLGLETEGEVVSIIPSGANAARTFPVKIRLDDHGGELKAGMSVIGYVPMSEPRTYLSVPRDAVQFTPRGTLVWTIGAGEGPMPPAEMVPVSVLFANGDWFAVEVIGEASLRDGQPVIVEGAELLFPGRMLVVDAKGDDVRPSPALPTAAADDEPASRNTADRDASALPG
jgi:membrane fusion protein (multidrug efflux system)